MRRWLEVKGVGWVGAAVNVGGLSEEVDQGHEVGGAMKEGASMRVQQEQAGPFVWLEGRRPEAAPRAHTQQR